MPANNKADQKREDLQLVHGRDCGPAWWTIENLPFGKVVGEQGHRDAENRIAQGLKASHLELID
jgi:hypothetical protein